MKKHSFLVISIALWTMVAAGCGSGGGANPLGNEGIESALLYSQEASIKDAPTQLRSKVAGIGKVELEWSFISSSDIEDEALVEFRIYRRQDEEGFFQEIAQIDTNFYLDYGLDNGVTYHYQVSALIDGAEILGGENASVNMSYDVDTGLVGAPHGIGQIKLTWREIAPFDLEQYDQTKMGRILGYDIYRSNSPDGDYEKLNSDPVTQPDYVDKDLENGHIYSYKMYVATELEPPSLHSKSVQVSSFERPRNLKVVTYNYRKVQLRWEKIYNLDNLSGFNVYRRAEEEEEYSLVAKVEDPEASTYTDGPVAERGLHYYRVSAYSEDGESNSSNEVSVKPFGFVYVTNYYGNALSVIRAQDDRLMAIMTLGDGPQGVALSPDGDHAYIANSRSNTLSVVDTYENKPIARIDMGDHPIGVVVHPDGSKVYVSNYYSDNIYVVDAENNLLLRSIGVGSGPRGLALSPDGSRLYVANYYSDTVSIIDTETEDPLGSIPVGSGPTNLVLSSDGGLLYVANHFTDTVSIINTQNLKRTSTILVKSGPIGLALSPDGRWLYVLSYFEGIFSVVDLNRKVEKASLKVGKFPQGITLFPELGKAYVTNFHSDTVSVIDLENNQLRASLNLGGGPSGIVLSP